MGEYNYEQFTNEIYNKYSKSIYKIICSKISNKSDAEDILQEVAFNAFRNYAKIKKHPNPEAWLHNSTRYFLLKYYTQNQKRLETVSLTVSLNEETVSDYYTIDMQLSRVFENFRGFLNEREIELLILKEVYGYTIEEITQKYGKSYNCIAVRLHRIYDKIKKNVKYL